MDVGEIKERQRKLWGSGDYSVLSALLAPAATALCHACAVSAGQEVLDVAAGDGNFAHACAREGASVVASDFVPAMVEAGRARSEHEGFDVEWVEADAEALPFDDARFDCVGSVFGAMLAPRPEVVARELFRVVRPGGTVGLTAWTLASVATELFEVQRRYVPPPAGLPPPELWADEATAGERFAGLASTIELERHGLVWAGESAEAVAERFLDAAPVRRTVMSSLSPEQRREMAREEHALFERHARAADGGVAVEAEYVTVVARRPG